MTKRRRVRPLGCEENVELVLAGGACTQGKYTEADMLLQEACATLEMRLGHEHPDVASSLTCRANVLAAQVGHIFRKHFSGGLGTSAHWCELRQELLVPLFSLVHPYCTL